MAPSIFPRTGMHCPERLHLCQVPLVCLHLRASYKSLLYAMAARNHTCLLGWQATLKTISTQAALMLSQLARQHHQDA